MSKLRKSSMLFVALILMNTILSILSVSSNAASKKSLLGKIRTSYPWASFYKTWYMDYDGNGRKEIFALTRKSGDSGYDLLFASDKECRCLMSTWVLLNGYGSYKVSKKQRLFIIDSYAGGSGSKSYCFQVKSGKVRSVLDSGSGLKHGKGKEFTVIKEAFDNDYGNDGLRTGHTYKVYYLKWTGKKFKEYKGTKISQKKLKKYSGAASVLNRAKTEGYRIGTIYKRGNGIININLYKNHTYGQTNENLTLKISGKKVKLVATYPKGSKWIYKYSYGGDYEKSMSTDW